jgi:hypothetical protein
VTPFKIWSDEQTNNYLGKHGERRR